MKKIMILFLLALLLIQSAGCTNQIPNTEILTTTAPLYYFTTEICYGTGITVECLITESVSCLHDYTLQTTQMRAIESAQLVILSGAGLEDSFSDILISAKATLDSSAGTLLLCHNADTEHHDDNDDQHHHEYDPHIWLSPDNASIMVKNIYEKLCMLYPQHKDLFDQNYKKLIEEFNALSDYASNQLSKLASRKLITFHDGFAYLANAFDLEILHAIEEESGREASASELINLCRLIEEHKVPCIFTEVNGSVSAAQIISSETDAKIYQLDMAMSGRNYFDSMYHNIDTLREALE